MHEFKLQRLMTDIFKHKLMCYILLKYHQIVCTNAKYECQLLFYWSSIFAILYNMMSTKHTKRFVCSKSKQDKYKSQT